MASKYGSDYGQEVNDFVIPSDAQRFLPMSERYAIGPNATGVDGKYGSEYGKRVPDNMLVGYGGTKETGYTSPGGDEPFDLNKLIGISHGSTSQYRNADSPSNRDIEKEYNLLNRSNITNSINDLFGSNLSGADIASRIAVLGGGLAGGLGMFAPNRQKVGYQGGIPKFTAERNMVTAPPAGSRPGAGGVNYSGDVNYVRQPGSPSTSSGGGSSGGGGFDLGNIAKVAGGAGLAALLGNYLSKPGALSGISGGLNSILKGIGSGSGSGSGTPAGTPDEFTGIDKQIRDNLASQLPNQLTDAEVGAEFDRLRGEIPEYEMPVYEEPMFNPSFYEDEVQYAKGGSVPRYLQGETDGMADKIPARIGRDQPAALSHGEFVVPADVVSHLGNGNSDAGAKKLYSMMDKIRQARTGTKKQGKKINPDSFMPGGLANAYANGGSVKRYQTGGALPAGSTGSEQTLASWTGDYVPNMLGKAEALANAPYQQYSGPLSAGASGLQQQAFQAAGNLSVPSSVGQATQTAGDIAAKAQGISYDPTKFENQFKAPDKYQNTSFTSGTFGQDQAQQYMNPYLQASLNPQLEEARRQSNISEQANKAAMTKAGAFGGGRSAILTAENQRNLGSNLAGITGKGYDTAYQNAMSQFNADQARNLQAQQASEQSKQFGATQGMTAADMMAKYGMSAQQASEQSKQFGANLGLQGLQTGLQAAQTQGNLGISGGQLGLAQLQEQSRLGAQQRGIEAEGIAADKAAFEEARANPYKMLQFQQSMLQGLPISATNYSMPEPDALTNAARGATTVNQLLKTLGLGGSGSPK
jgi:hypothetical protein